MVTEIIILILSGLAAVAFYLYKILVLDPSQVKNPFENDVCRSKEPLVHDQKERDKVIKQGFALNKVPSNLDAIVIGSGIGGLSTAAIMAKAGKKVLVLEQHDQAGGCCHTFIDKGYEFDVGIHYIGEQYKGSMHRTFLDQITDGQLDWAPIDKEYDVVSLGFGEDRKTYSVLSGKNEWKKYLMKTFPSEEVGIEKFFQYLRICDKNGMWGVLLKMIPLPVSKFIIFAGLIDRLTDYFKWNSRTVIEVVSELTDNKDLQAVMMYCYGDFGTYPSKAGFPMQATLHTHFTKGAFYPIGGASEIAFHIIPTIERAGGRVLVRAPVSEIITANGATVGVKVQKPNSTEGVVIKAPMVISNAGLYNTFQRLLPEPVAKKSYFRDIADNMEHGVPLLSVFVGLNIDTEELGVKAQNVWAFSSNDVEKCAVDYFALSPEEAMDAEVPLIFLSFPSSKDPTWNQRYPGKSTMAVITLANYKWFEQWENDQVKKRGVDYDALKNAIGYKMIEQAEKMYPQIKDKIDYVDIGSPLSNNYYIGSPRGEVYGLDHTQERFAAEMTAKLRPKTDVPGLFMTGQDVLSCGFTGGLYGGLIAAQAALGRNVFDDLTTLQKRLYPRVK